MKILVLGGGNSPEREVSLRSAKSVAQAAKDAGFEVIQADPGNGMNVLDGLADTIVFPILHGVNGEDGALQKEMEARNLPFLGTQSQQSVDCFNKWTTRQRLTQAGIPMPEALEVNKESYKDSSLSKQPHVLKVLNGGSSIGTLIVRDPSLVTQAEIDGIFEMENKAVLEKLVIGTEITVPVLDDKALPVIEIVPPPNGEFDYDNKYNGATQELVPPKNVSVESQKKAQKLAEQAHKIMGCRHLSRTDFMIGQNGELLALEINTMPGMTDQSLYPKSAAVAGLPMPELIKKFVDLVQRDYNLVPNKG